MSASALPPVSFLDFYARLPTGGIGGRASDTFGPAKMPDPFVAPNLRPIVASDAAGLTFVSARGAMGKSFFAERVAAMKAAPLWRLDRDKAVSADAFNAKLMSYLGATRAKNLTRDKDALVLIDALDEARMRVSGVSWTEFLESLIPYAGDRRLLLFGRERVVEDLWMFFDDSGVACDWFEISYFDRDQRVEYVDRRVSSRGRPAAGEVYTTARDGVLRALAGTVDAEIAESFVGYAPVLDAVVALLADENLANVRNTSADTVPAGSRINVLITILESLLDREQQKTTPVSLELGLDSGQAYGRAEQIEWLSSDLMGAHPPALEWCPPQERGEYAKRVREFLRDHPFRAEDEWASPVFSAYVAAQQFDDPRISSALQAVGRRTGLLFDFVTTEGLADFIDESQFAALHASMLAAEWQAVEAAVAIEASDDGEVAESLQGELALFEGEVSRRTAFVIALDLPGVLRVLGPTAFLSVDFPGTVVLTSANGALALGPECFIRCGDLRLVAETTEILRRSRDQDNESGDESSVVFEVAHNIVLGGTLVGRPTLETFEIRVPDAMVLVYPWVAHRAALMATTAAPDERAERFVRRLVALLRRHGHTGRMAVFDMKLQGRQSIKGGDFLVVVEDLEELGIVSHEGALIYLQPDWEQNWFSGKGHAGLPTLEDNRAAWTPALARISARLSA